MTEDRADRGWVSARFGFPLYNTSINKRKLNMYLPLKPLIALVAGILILVRPALMKYFVAFYLIAIGVLGLIRF